MNIETIEAIFWCMIGLIGVGLILVFISFCIHEAKFYNAEPIRIKATLINHEYKPSTKRTHATPVFNSKGNMSMAVYSTGHDAIHTTIWDCGYYGRLICIYERVYRFAKDKSILILKQVNDDVRIWDIDNTVIL